MGCNSSNRSDFVEPSARSPAKRQFVHAGTFFQIQTVNFQSIYFISELIGDNLTSEIRTCVHKTTQTKRSVKVIRKPTHSSKKNEIMREIEILKKLDHPNIVRLHQLFEDERRFYIVTGSLTGRILFDEILKRGSFSETDAASIMHQLLAAVNYIHENKIMHRDLKPESILLEAHNLRITLYDFGNAAKIGSGAPLSESVGSTYYTSPEVLFDEEEYNEACDLWSCGVILYILISGSAPFEGKTERDIKNRIRTGRFSMESAVWEHISPEAKSLLRGLLTIPASERLTALQVLNHPWFAKFKSRGLSQVQLNSVLDNLKTFHSSVKLKEAVLTFITTMILTAQDTDEMREVFSSIDKNHDGKLSRQELLDEYASIKSLEEATQEVDRIFETVDTDKSGFIDYSEFLKATVDHSNLLSASNLERAFAAFDTDSSGTITKEELIRLLGEASVVGEWSQILDAVDSDKNGGIELKEFKELLMNRLL
jgi:calcium-dependent protein kinase